jgi:DNA-binding IclR family transcriptional regulator
MTATRIAVWSQSDAHASTSDRILLDVSHAPGLQRNQSLLRAIDLLRALGERPEGTTVSELARAAGLAVPTARRLVATLADAGLAEQLPTDGRWVLGRELVRLGRAADPFLAVVGRARPIIERLADEGGEAAVLAAARLPHAVDVILQVDAPRMVGVASWMGRSFGLHASAGARLAFASLSDDEVREILGPGPFHRYTAHTITDPDEFLADLVEVRRSGVAISVDELEDGLTSIAVPVGPLGAGHTFQVGMLGPTSRLGAERRAALLPLIRACAREVAAVVQAA